MRSCWRSQIDLLFTFAPRSSQWYHDRLVSFLAWHPARESDVENQVPPRPRLPCGARTLGRSEHGGLHICRFYFPLEHIVFSGVLASQKFAPSLGGEEWFKNADVGLKCEAVRSQSSAGRRNSKRDGGPGYRCDHIRDITEEEV